MGEEVCAAFEELFLLICEYQAKSGGVCFEGIGVVAVYVNGVSEPAFVEIPCSLHGLGVGGGVGEGDLVAAVCFEGDGAVETHGFAEAVCGGVGEEGVVAAEVRLLFWGDGCVCEVVFWILRYVRDMESNDS